MFLRKIEKSLLEWKESLKIRKSAFILKGLRQVGKTFIVKKFAIDNYENVIYINFKTELKMKKAFDDNLSVNDIIANISAFKPGEHFIPFKTVLILDEIQECSGARACIKPFMEDKRFDIIATGSLLGIKGYNHKYSGGVSVGFEHTVYMKPMDFEEFLWAKGIDQEITDYIRDCFNKKEPVRLPIHDAMQRYFKEYICIGGMPAVVDMFIQTNDYTLVRNLQRDILESYKDDYGKHLNENEEEVLDLTLLARINKVFESIPSQLAKENKKFMYSKIEKKGSALKFDPAIQWLKDYGLIDISYNLSILESPLKGNKIDNIFKVYMADSGLFIAMLDDDAVGEILLGDMGIYKGAIYENIVADAFHKNEKELYYFSKDSGLEIDFITRLNKKITLIEVKATSGNTKSSKIVLNDKKTYPEVEQVIKLGAYNVGMNNNILTLPSYMSFLLQN